MRRRPLPLALAGVLILPLLVGAGWSRGLAKVPMGYQPAAVSVADTAMAGWDVSPGTAGSGPVAVVAVDHPAGRFRYEVDGRLHDRRGQMHVIDRWDPDKPRRVTTVDLGAGIPTTSLAIDPDGAWLYAATGTHTLVLDLSRPGRPVINGRIYDYMVRHHSQVLVSDVTDDILGQRRFLTVVAHLGGGDGCQTGTVFVYDITGQLRSRPIMVMEAEIPSVVNDDARSECPTLQITVDGPARSMVGQWAIGSIGLRTERVPYDVTSAYQATADFCRLVPV